MLTRYCFGLIVLVSLSGIGVANPAQTHSQQHKFKLSQLENYGCEAKGRVQDCSGKVIEEILARGKDSIPILISQLTDTSQAKNP
jgi:hypothetical protein